MAKNISQRIVETALELLDETPEGIRYSELRRQIAKADPSFNTSTITMTVWKIHERYPEKVYKPARGLFRLTKYRDDEEVEPEPERTTETVPAPAPKIKEEEFYQPFADWLVNDIEDCTRAIALGGNKFGDKWGTPDVIGKRESKRSDIIRATEEIVSAEIKPDVHHLVTAFGQACAYCLFSHKTYLVVPRQAPKAEIDRLDALCQVFGIGLVLFNADDANDPDFNIRCRPRYQRPDLFYANENLKKIEGDLFH